MDRWYIAAISLIMLAGGCAYEPQHEVGCVVDDDCADGAICTDEVCVIDDGAPPDMPDDEEVERLEIAPEMAELLPGDTQQFEAKAFADDETELDVDFDWSIDDSSLATVDSTGLVTALAPGTAIVQVSAAGVRATAEVLVFEPVVSIEVTPSPLELPQGHSAVLSATPLDGADEPVTGREIAWSSSEPETVHVLGDGTITAISVGEATVTASVGDVSGEAIVTVTTNDVVSVEIEPDDPDLILTDPSGPSDEVVFQATIEDAEGIELDPRGRSFDWSSTNASAATRNAGAEEHQNKLDPRSVGSGELIVTVDGNASDTVTWSVIDPPVSAVDVMGADAVIPVGSTRALEAEVRAGGEVVEDRPVVWSSTDEAVAIIDQSGMLVALAPGLTTIEAEVEDFKATVDVEVIFLLDQVSAGVAHSCGVSPDGVGFCWGDNGQSRLGVGSSPTGSAEPLVVAGGVQFAEIWAAATFSCGRSVAGEGYCWGEAGHLGATDGSASDEPRAVDGGHVFEHVRAGYEHACGITTNGDVYCWGEGNFGRLGDDDNSDRDEPVEVVFAPVGTPIGLAIGREHTCTVTDASEVWCWGKNTDGSLGNGDDSEERAPVEVTASLAFEDVTAGDSVTCGRLDDDSVYCWGDNSVGQLGNGDLGNDSDVPAELPAVSMTAIDLGSDHGCGIDAATGEVHCWGSASDFRLGNADDSMDLDAPAPTDGNLIATAIASGSSHTCAIAQDQKPYCWGENVDGRAGTDAEEDVPAPALVWP